jgi:hypothetical protein
MGHYDQTQRAILAWQSTLGAMKEYGARVQLAGCACPARPVDLDPLIEKLGPKAELWDMRVPCPSCGESCFYMASPAPGTPFGPLLRAQVFGPAYVAKRKAFLDSFGFSQRDVLRIKALAEAVEGLSSPAALADLDTPYRVGAVRAGEESRTSGQVLGHWAGRVLVYWKMSGREFDVWERRRPGPRRVGP